MADLDVIIGRGRRRDRHGVRLDYENAPAARARDCSLDDTLWDLGRPPDPRLYRSTGALPPATRWDAGLKAFQTVGEDLFRRVFDAEGRGVLVATLAGVVGAPAGRVRIRLDVNDDPGLFRVPWETLYDAGGQKWLAIGARTPVVRVLRSEGVVAPPRLSPRPLKLLIAVANPAADLDTAAELTDMERRIAAIQGDDDVIRTVEVLRDASLGTLREAIAVHQPHILHFIGHGGVDEKGGFLRLHDADDRTRAARLDADRLAALFTASTPQLVVLNSCQGAAVSNANPFGGTAQSLIRHGVPMVAAMQFPISDRAAILFSQTFYGEISRGTAVDVAVNLGRAALFSDAAIEQEMITPVLYVSDEATGELLAPIPTIAPPGVEARAESPPKTRTRANWIPGAAGAAVLVLGAVATLLLTQPPLEMRRETPTGAAGVGPPGSGFGLDPTDAKAIDDETGYGWREPAAAEPAEAIQVETPPRARAAGSAPASDRPGTGRPIVAEVPVVAPDASGRLPAGARVSVPVGAEVDPAAYLDAAAAAYFATGATIELVNASRDPAALHRMRQGLFDRGVPAAALITHGQGESWAGPGPGAIELAVGADEASAPPSAALRFVAGSPALAPESGPALQGLAAALVDRDGLGIRVVGYADVATPPRDRAVLAAARAEGVAIWLRRAGVAEVRTATAVPPGPVFENRTVGARTEAFVIGGDAVFFAHASAEVGDESDGALDHAAAWLDAHPDAALVLRGYSSRSGTPASNLDLSRTRAEAVAGALAARGVSRDRLSVTAQGETASEGEAESRRVDLVVTDAKPGR